MDDELETTNAPNCPQCLEQMEPVVGAWWCESCSVSVQAAGQS